MAEVRSIEFVGGPYCGGVVANATLEAATVILPDCIHGEAVEYVYQTTERVSQYGNQIVEFVGRRIVGKCGKAAE